MVRTPPEGTDKPYRCKDGFFLRSGPNSQQLNRDEILRFAIKSNKVRFDEQFETAGVSSEGAKLCRWLALHGPASMQDNMGAFHISKTTVHRRITKLIADGWIEVHGSGRSTNYALSNVSICNGKREER